MARIAKIIAVSCVVALLAGGCSNEAREPSTTPGTAPSTTASTTPSTAVRRSLEPLTVVASFGPLAEVARRVGGEEVRVINLTKAGVEAHDLELNTQQIDSLQDAALVVYLGDSFQSAVEDALKSRNGPVLNVLTKIDPLAATNESHADEGHAEEEVHGSSTGTTDDGEHGRVANDPHFWLDPIRMSSAAKAVRDTLTTIAPAGASAFATNAAAFTDEMTALDRDMTAGLAQCSSRTFVTAHSAFRYLAARYSLEQVPVAGINPDVEPDPARLAAVADLVKQKNVSTIFTEELASPEVAEAIARETGATTAVLSTIEGFTDEDVAAGATYATKMRDNLRALQKALFCS